MKNSNSPNPLFESFSVYLALKSNVTIYSRYSAHIIRKIVDSNSVRIFVQCNVLGPHQTKPTFHPTFANITVGQDVGSVCPPCWVSQHHVGRCWLAAVKGTSVETSTVFWYECRPPGGNFNRSATECVFIVDWPMKILKSIPKSSQWNMNIIHRHTQKSSS